MLAATAMIHGLALVTHNTIDVEDVPVNLLNPWQGWCSPPNCIFFIP